MHTVNKRKVLRLPASRRKDCNGLDVGIGIAYKFSLGSAAL